MLDPQEAFTAHLAAIRDSNALLARVLESQVRLISAIEALSGDVNLLVQALVQEEPRARSSVEALGDAILGPRRLRR